MFKFLNWGLFVFSILAAIGLISTFGTMDAEGFVGGLYVVGVLYITAQFLFVIDKKQAQRVAELDKSIDNLLKEMRVSQTSFEQEIAHLHRSYSPSSQRVSTVNRKKS